MRTMTWLLGLAGAGCATASALVFWMMRARDTDAVSCLRIRLEHPSGEPAGRFDPAMVAELPEPVRRYLLHAIQPGTPLADSVRLSMTGRIRLGPDQAWHQFSARQLLAPPRGFVWEASVGTGLSRFAGADMYANGQGRVAFRLWDLVPVARSRGPDVSRSARGRLAIESIWLPAALLPRRGVTWAAIDDRTVRATLSIDGETIPLTMTVDQVGRLESVAIDRWGNLTTDAQYAWIPFGANILAERTFGGYTVPSGLKVGWWRGTDRAFDFFDGEILQATYEPSGNEGGSR